MLFPRLYAHPDLSSYMSHWGRKSHIGFLCVVGRPASLQGWTSYPHILSNRCLSLGLGWFNNFEWWYGWGLWLMDEGRAGAWYPHKGGTGAWQGPSFLRRLFKECMGRWPGWQSVTSLLLHHIKRKWRWRTLAPSHNSWSQTPSEVIAKSTTRVWCSKGTHVWLDGTWFERNDRPGWFLLPHFTPHPSPQSCGVNFFAQDLSSGAPFLEYPYVFPPLSLWWVLFCVFWDPTGRRARS